MRLVLHIGANKTGTSTLQATMRAHERELAAAGILYPVLEGHPHNHTPLIALVKPLTGMPRSLRDLGDMAAIRRFGEGRWNEILDQVGASDADVCVLSSEYLFNPWGIRSLAERLREAFDDLVVVAYVRAPAPRYVSVMQQQVKTGGRVSAPVDFGYESRNALTHHLRVFDGAVLVRPFDRMQLVDGCIVRDFLRTVFPDREDRLREIEVHDRNESISAEAMCILQERRATLSGDVIRRLSATMRGTRPRLRPEIEARLVQQHRGELDWLRERFGIVFADCGGTWTGDDDPAGWTSVRLRDVLDLDEGHIDALAREVLAEYKNEGRGVGARGAEVTGPRCP